MGQSQDKTITHIATLLSRYGFELNGVPIPQLIEDLSATYSVYWIRLAIVEALYQGRYKVISIEHILMIWKRRGQPTYHFNHDFERFITHKVVMDDLTDEVTKHDDSPETNQTSDEENQEISETATRFTPVDELVKQITASNLTFLEELSAKLEVHRDLPEHQAETQGTNVKHQHPSANNHNDHSIHQFIPHRDFSEFYSKLRAVAHQELAENVEDE